MKGKLVAGTPIAYAGSMIKAHRIGAALSQRGLAERLGLHHTYLSKVEAGVEQLGRHSIERLQSALGLTVTEVSAIEMAYGRLPADVEATIIEIIQTHAAGWRESLIEAIEPCMTEMP